MPFKDKDKQREYQRQWRTKRRANYLLDRSCVVCGSTEELQIDHKDPNTKVSHKIWSWSEERRNQELAKCQVLCTPCHTKKTNVHRIVTKLKHGSRFGYRQLRCRCEDCRIWNRDYQSFWRQKTMDL